MTNIRGKEIKVAHRRYYDVTEVHKINVFLISILSPVLMCSRTTLSLSVTSTQGQTSTVTHVTST